MGIGGRFSSTVRCRDGTSWKAGLTGLIIAASVVAQSAYAQGHAMIGTVLYIPILGLWALMIYQASKDTGDTGDTGVSRDVLGDRPWFRKRIWMVLFIVLITLLGAGFRFIRLDSLPERLWNDERANVANAKEILDGKFAVFFPENNGREALYMYCIAFCIRLFGESNGAVRLSGALIGTLTIPLLFCLVRRFLGDLPGILSAMMLALNPWHIIMSRIAYRLILTIPIMCIALLFFEYGLSTRRKGWLILSAAAMGIGQYAYSTFRLAPAVLLIYWLILIVMERQRWVEWAKPMILYGSVCFLLAVPLLRYSRSHETDFYRRWEQVSSFNRPDPWHAVPDTVLRTCLMVNYRGCAYKKYNVPDRPVLPGWLSLFFPPGILAAVWFSRSSRGRVLFLLWLAGGVFPGMITWPAPWFSRPILALPPILALSALGLETLLRLVAGSNHSVYHRLRWVVCGCALVFLFVSAVQGVFGEWAAAIQPVPKAGPVIVYK